MVEVGMTVACGRCRYGLWPSSSLVYTNLATRICVADTVYGQVLDWWKWGMVILGTPPPTVLTSDSFVAQLTLTPGCT